MSLKLRGSSSSDDNNFATEEDVDSIQKPLRCIFERFSKLMNWPTTVPWLKSLKQTVVKYYTVLKHPNCFQSAKVSCILIVIFNLGDIMCIISIFVVN